MNFQKLIAGAFAILFIIILYIIIYYALKIMNKDIRGGNKRRGTSKKGQKSYGIEVESSGDNPNLKQGTLIHIRDTVSIGRRDDNSIVLTDSFVSGYHAKLFVRNNNFYVEDLGSTNGTFLNDSRIDGRAKLNVNDELKIGSVVFRVI